MTELAPSGTRHPQELEEDRHWWFASRTRALLAMMHDKDMAGVAGKLASVVDDWCVAGLDGPRGATARQLAQALDQAGVPGTPELLPDVAAAYGRLRRLSRPGDRIVVFGSFHTVATVLHLES